jgi:TonB family protein
MGIRNCIFIFLVVTNSAFGQRLVKEFFTENGKETDEASSYYYSIGKKKEFYDPALQKIIEAFIDTAWTYYSQSNKIRSVTLYASDGVLQGSYFAFYENGKIKEKGMHIADRRVGNFISWYDNEKPHRTIKYPEKIGEFSSFPPIDFKIINYWDSTGNQIITNTNGFCECYLSSSKEKEIGKVVNGVRDSLWSSFSNDSLVFREEYNKGVFLHGVRYDGNKEYAYSAFEQPPEITGGFENLNMLVVKNIRYPKEAKRMNITGTVEIGFIIAKDGSMQNARVLKGIGAGCDEEALRVVMLAKTWIPGQQRGVPVDVKFVYPIKFKLD